MTQSIVSPNKLAHKHQFEAIGTQWSIETVGPLGDTSQKIIERINEFDQIYSRFRDDSLVTKISRSAGEYRFPVDVEKMIGLYQSLYDATDGAMTPLVGTALAEAGYDGEYTLQPKSVQAIPAWHDVMRWDGQVLSTTKPIILDFGAAGKGYLIDIVAEILEKEGHNTYVIDASGDIRTRGLVQNIGLENPSDSDSVIGVAQLNDSSICASATNRRTWGDWHHVIDAKTAKPTTNIVATWVIAEDTMIADGIATALFFVNADRLEQWKFEYVRMDKHGHIDKSPGFVGELFA